MRRFLIDTIDKVSNPDNIIILAGKAGSGKTHLLNKLRYSLDLEGCARHRGSAFGGRVKPQPTPASFENYISIEFLKLPFSIPSKLFLEDESRSIGTVSIPNSLHKAMNEAPLAYIEESLDSRVETILNDYIISNYLDYKNNAPETVEELFEEFLLSALQRINRRLGQENYAIVKQDMESAIRQQQDNGDTQQHRIWIARLLRDYYDPMYDYQLNKKNQRIIYRGNSEEFQNWSSHLSSGLCSP